MNARNPETKFGRAVRGLWQLDPNGVFLNHGSFGACPTEVQAAQDAIRRRMEAQPDVFFRREIQPDNPASTIRAAAARIAKLVGCSGDDLAFVENATSGVQAAMNSIDFKPGDRILVTDHGYNAVRLMVEARCRETGAEPLVVAIPVPTTPDGAAQRIADAVTPAVRLAIVDHITSPTGIVLPLDRIVPSLRRHGALVFVDGAHGVGQVALDLPAIGADWYVSNAHKWLFAPKGSAFLYASKEAAARTRPIVVSHYVESGFPRSFDYVGTRDNSSWLAVPAAIDFFERLGPAALHAYQAQLIDKATELMASVGAEPIASRDMSAAMRSFLLDWKGEATRETARAFLGRLWDEERIQVAAMAFEGRMLLRVSAQAYVDEEDLVRLRDVMARKGRTGA
jgi:isopenicillin-N epimerase